MVAFPGPLSKNGKRTYIPSKLDRENFNWYSVQSSFSDSADKPILIPCGKCLGCRLDYSREWAARCMLELKDHDSAYFVTATYNDSEIPRTYYSDPDTGEALLAYSLRKKDFQLWLKNIRSDFPSDKIRFYGCGEYGSETFRPHYHVILFGLHLDDLKFYKRTDQGILYTSDKLSNTWFRFDPVQRLHFPRGFVVVGEVNWNTCAYVSRYTAKKYLTLGDDFFEKFNLEKPFVQMSRRPGIGRSFLEKHPEMFDSSKLFLPSGDSVKEVSIPRYFYKILESTDPELCYELKERNRKAGSVYSRSLIRSYKRSYADLLADASANLLAKSRSLHRDL